MPTQQELNDRKAFFLAAAQKFCGRMSRDGHGKISIREEALDHAVRLYFLLSDAYKRKRIHKPEEHRSEPYKVAAITSATLSTICILEPDDTENVASEMAALCNPMFAVYCACAILGVVDWKIRAPILQRHYFALDVLDLEACSTYCSIAETSPEAALLLPDIEIPSRDLGSLDMLVNIYLEWWKSAD